MIKMTLGELLIAEPVLAKINKHIQDMAKPEAPKDEFNKPADFKFTYRMGRLIQKLQPELDDYYEQRLKLLNKFGEEEKTTKIDEVSGESVEAGTGKYKILDVDKFNKYVKQLTEFELEISGVFPFKIEELSQFSILTPQDVIDLGKLIEAQSEIEQDKPRKKISIEIEE
jgi:hypothetical protein